MRVDKKVADTESYWLVRPDYSTLEIPSRELGKTTFHKRSSPLYLKSRQVHHIYNGQAMKVVRVMLGSQKKIVKVALLFTC